ncbi:MAG: HAD family hydrolase [Bacteroidetes bacterium]|nr:HAD family hydrolase [Bacteroidota bacterium]
MKHAALFLDRDGTINYDPGYIKDPKLVKLYPGVAESISELKEFFGFLMIVISNQSGIARGLMTHQDVRAVNKRINELLAEKKTSIDEFYYCPYHSDFDDEEKCSCRKPSPKLVFEASEKHNIDLKRSYFIGDKISDVECGINAGLKTILLKNTIQDSEIIHLKNEGKTPNFVAGNFTDACEYIKKDFMEVSA